MVHEVDIFFDCRVDPCGEDREDEDKEDSGCDHRKETADDRELCLFPDAEEKDAEEGDKADAGDRCCYHALVSVVELRACDEEDDRSDHRDEAEDEREDRLFLLLAGGRCRCGVRGSRRIGGDSRNSRCDRCCGCRDCRCSRSFGCWNDRCRRY